MRESTQTRHDSKTKRAHFRIHAKKHRETPKSRYNTQKRQSRRRDIPFCLTFDEWWKLWEPHWEKRGTCSDCYVMARFGDQGPYAAGNVEITTAAANHSAAHRGEKTHLARLTASAVRDIRKKLAKKARVATIAREHGVSWWTISRIRDGVTWRHVQ